MVEVQHDLRWEDRLEDIWVIVPTTRLDTNRVLAFTSEEAARLAYRELRGEYHSQERATLNRPSLAPIYGGPTLLEALWNEMDRLMEALMTGADAEDGGDKYRAQELAWAIAIVTNPYDPSMDRVRAEAMRRWEEAQHETAVV